MGLHSHGRGVSDPSDGIAASIWSCVFIKPLPQGQWWRLLTCALMHGGWLHLAVNFSSLLILGRWMEAHTRSSYLPLVFVVSALVGSFAFLKFGKDAVPRGRSRELLLTINDDSWESWVTGGGRFCRTDSFR